MALRILRYNTTTINTFNQQTYDILTKDRTLTEAFSANDIRTHPLINDIMNTRAPIVTFVELNKENNILSTTEEARNYLLGHSYVLDPVVLSCLVHMKSKIKPVKTELKKHAIDSSLKGLLQLAGRIEKDPTALNSSIPHMSILKQLIGHEKTDTNVKRAFDNICKKETNFVGGEKNCPGFRYRGCFSDQPLAEKVSIILRKTACHTMNMLSLGLGYFFRSC